MRVMKNGKINKTSGSILDQGLHHINQLAKKYLPEFYVGYSTQRGLYTDDVNNHIQPGPKATSNSPSKPAAYSRTTAKTASDIAQGGMTKDEVEEFNLKHPNETALRRN